MATTSASNLMGVGLKQVLRGSSLMTSGTTIFFGSVNSQNSCIRKLGVSTNNSTSDLYLLATLAAVRLSLTNDTTITVSGLALSNTYVSWEISEYYK